MEFNPEIYEEIELNYSLKYEPNNFLGFKFEFPITSKLCDKIKTWAKVFSVIIIALMVLIVFVEHDMVNQVSEFTYYNKDERFITKTVCLIQLLVTIAYFILWLKLRMPLAIKKWNDDHQE